MLIQKNPNVLDLSIFFCGEKKKRDILWAQDILWAREEHTKQTFAPFWSQYLKNSSLEAHLKVAGKFRIWELSVRYQPGKCDERTWEKHVYFLLWLINLKYNSN